MYGIMRCEKRGRTAVYGLQSENNRDSKREKEFSASDINYDKTDSNYFFKKSVSWNETITNTIKKNAVKEKKDSIVMIDTLYTASPEFFKDKSREECLKYFKDCLNFHVKEFCSGDKSLLVNAVVHFDETTPHMHVESVPIVRDDKGVHLSAKILMGNRNTYKVRQDHFYESVSKSYGLERGKEQDPEHKRVHQKVQDYKIAKNKETLHKQKDLLKEQHALIKDTQELVESENQKLKEAQKLSEKYTTPKIPFFKREYIKVEKHEWEKQQSLNRELDDKLQTYQKTNIIIEEQKKKTAEELRKAQDARQEAVRIKAQMEQEAAQRGAELVRAQVEELQATESAMKLKQKEYEDAIAHETERVSKTVAVLSHRALYMEQVMQNVVYTDGSTLYERSGAGRIKDEAQSLPEAEEIVLKSVGDKVEVVPYGLNKSVTKDHIKDEMEHDDQEL